MNQQTDNNMPAFIAGKQGARLIAISGESINQPIVQYRPFVMNARAAIDHAIHDCQSNNFVQERARVKKINSVLSGNRYI